MSTEIDREKVERILALFDIEDRNEVREYCRDIVIDRESLFQLIMAGRHAGLHPFVYDCHFSEFDPDVLSPEDRDLTALAANGIVPLDRRAIRAATRVARCMEGPGMFAAHLLYTPSERHWHLFCFDGNDGLYDDANSGTAAQLHYSRNSLVTMPLPDVWRHVCMNDVAPRSIRIPCDARADRRTLLMPQPIPHSAWTR